MNSEVLKILKEISLRPKLVICGGGHISLYLAQIAEMLEFDVYVLDDRQEFANIKRFPDAHIFCQEFATAIREIESDGNTFFVIITRGHEHDLECAHEILKKDYAYLGMIGSKNKVAVCIEKLKDRGHDLAKIKNIYAPVGLKIGAKTPGEIALSILAQMIEVKSSLNINSGINEKQITELSKLNIEGLFLATIISKRGSTPRGEGTNMLICRDGEIYGTIGGGLSEKKVIDYVKNANEFPATLNLDMFGGEMICGGSIEVRIEKI